MKQLIGLLALISCSNAFIVPQEVPSILSLVYSNIPPIKKGTDSRVGFGYRLGEHADFQVLFELGPQTNTRPIGEAANNGGSETSKRNVNQSDYNKKIKPPINGQQWLNNWSEEMKMKTKTPPKFSAVQSGGQQNVKTVPFISEMALKQLQQLYGNNQRIQMSQDIGTLPAESLEQEVQMAMKKMNENGDNLAMQNNIKTKQKISAELQDVSLDDDSF